jgi:hypothetical protein
MRLTIQNFERKSTKPPPAQRASNVKGYDFFLFLSGIQTPTIGMRAGYSPARGVARGVKIVTRITGQRKGTVAVNTSFLGGRLVSF